MKIFLALLVMLTACSSPNVCIDDDCIKVEVADDPGERQQGLMHRTELEGGMLFVFEEEKVHEFWMKDTLIPLDMVWISKGNVIVDIQTAYPCTEDPCMHYVPKGPSLYVLELNAGYCGMNGIEIGDAVDI